MHFYTSRNKYHRATVKMLKAKCFGFCSLLEHTKKLPFSKLTTFQLIKNR